MSTVAYPCTPGSVRPEGDSSTCRLEACGTAGGNTPGTLSESNDGRKAQQNTYAGLRTKNGGGAQTPPALHSYSQLTL
eukprot:scaffold259911_cov34-Tisochrysis_lutea.AAC.1